MIVRFFNWQSWVDNILCDGGLSGWLGSDVTQRSYLKVASKEVQEGGEVWLLAASKDKDWRAAAWIKLRKRNANEPDKNDDYSTLVYYDPASSVLLGDLETKKLLDIPELDAILKTYGKQLEQQGKAGFEFQGERGKKIFTLMRKIASTGISFSSLIDNEVINKTKNVKSDPLISMVGEFKSSVETKIETSPAVLAGEKVEGIETALSDFEDSISSEFSGCIGTDVDAVVKRRIGQGLFRDLLQKKYGSRCCLSGVKNSRLLIASHIVPWSKSSAVQKVDPENGLLLSITFDALFDKGLVSFSDEGSLLRSDQLDDETVELLGVNLDASLPPNLLTEKRRSNLQWHRKINGFEQ